MPGIGMRIMKTSIAVGVCLLLSFLRPDGIVFYSCIAAVLCIQQDIANSKRVAINRIKGTLLGGFYGLLLLMLEKYVIPSSDIYIRYIMITVMIIPIIYTTVLLKMTSSAYISCVVFMSVSITHASDINPFLFTCDRMIDTLIGILVAITINAFPIHFVKNKTILFILQLDGIQAFQAYDKVILRRLLNEGAHIMIYTHHTPSHCIRMLHAIPLRLPMLVLHGAASYDVNRQIFDHTTMISQTVYEKVINIIQQFDTSVFVYTVVRDVLHIYYQELQHPAALQYYDMLRKQPYQAVICQEKPEQLSAICIQIVDNEERLERMSAMLQESEAISYKCYIDPYVAHKGYAIMTIVDLSADQMYTDFTKAYDLKRIYHIRKGFESTSLKHQLNNSDEKALICNLTGETIAAMLNILKTLFYKKQ